MGLRARGGRARGQAIALLVALLWLVAAASTAGADRAARRKRANLPSWWRWPPTPAMKRAGKECIKELRELGVEFKRARRRPMIPTPVVVPDMVFSGIVLTPTYRKPPFVMDCHLARALARHASLFVELGVGELRFSTIHDYRRVRLDKRERRALSRHALGFAIDIFEVVRVDGTVLKVEEDYWSSDITLLLADLALRQSGGFRAILTPRVDPTSHDDHFHLEARYELPRQRRRAQKRKRAMKRRKARRRRRAARQRRRARERRKERRERRERRQRRERRSE